MDNTCYKCGAAVQEGTPFCPSCGAPQIRVNVPEMATADSPAFAPGTPGEMQPPARPVSLGTGPLPIIPSDNIQWKRALGPILAGAVLVGFGPMLPLGLLWTVVAISGGGAIAVGLYHRRHLSTKPITSSMGAKVGTVTGVAGYVLFALMAVLAFTVSGDQIRAEMMKRIEAMPAQASDPRSAEMLREFVEKVSTPEGMALMFTIAMAFLFFLFLGFGALGGVIGASLTRRSDAHR